MMNVKTRINELEEKRKSIQLNTDLSEQGKSKALAEINREREALQAEALRSLKSSWSDFKAKALENLENIREAEAEAAESWNYSRLEYMARSLGNSIANTQSISDVLDLHERIKESGDAHARRAWYENAGELVRAKYRDGESMALIAELKRDAPSVSETQELRELRAEGEALSRQAGELLEQTERASNYFYPQSSVFNSSNPFESVRAGVKIEQRVNPETLETISRVTIDEI